MREPENESKSDVVNTVPCTSLLADWSPRPHEGLRQYPDGTLFLLRLHSGSIHVCRLIGNMDTDQSWKAQRLTDFKVIRLETLKYAGFILLTGLDGTTGRKDTLAGLWFHSRKDGEIEWQGKVLRDLGNGNYIIQLFEWAMGTPTVQKMITSDEMKGWDFYPTDRAMRYAWNKSTGGSEKDFEWGEKVVERSSRTK